MQDSESSDSSELFNSSIVLKPTQMLKKDERRCFFCDVKFGQLGKIIGKQKHLCIVCGHNFCGHCISDRKVSQSKHAKPKDHVCRMCLAVKVNRHLVKQYLKQSESLEEHLEELQKRKIKEEEACEKLREKLDEQKSMIKS